MIIAREKRKTNIAEYILYLWQVEDLLRACAFNPENIEERLVKQFNADEKTTAEISDWYSNLSAMMQLEKIQEKGHLQVLKNLVNDLNEFHLKMLEVQNDQAYIHLYRSNRSAIADFVGKAENPDVNEVEACLNALYGFVLLKLKKAEITPQTLQTIEGFGRLIGHLSARYIQFENDEFEF
ncbi:MAG: DUF4924 family protein [Prolixibacteraceae bacterium]|jgi:hypothetical protein